MLVKKKDMLVDIWVNAAGRHKRMDPFVWLRRGRKRGSFWTEGLVPSLWSGSSFIPLPSIQPQAHTHYHRVRAGIQKFRAEHTAPLFAILFEERPWKTNQRMITAIHGSSLLLGLQFAQFILSPISHNVSVVVYKNIQTILWLFKENRNTQPWNITYQLLYMCSFIAATVCHL